MKKISSLIVLLLFTIACSEDTEPGEINSDLELPIVNFTSNKTLISAGQTVSFTSTALNAEELSWSFPGGDPVSSTEANPSVTYEIPGSYSATLTGSNAGGNDTETKSDYIEVLPTQFQTATYTVTFSGSWSVASHPVDFPTGQDHFSSAVGMVHRAGAQLFETDELASKGIEDMAENGVNAALFNEVEALINSEMALNYITGGGLGAGDGQRSFEIEVNSDYPLVTIVSMIAPSPDWFVAIHEVSLYENGDFVDALTIEADSYDAGTDDGVSFTSPNADSNPAGVIRRITTAPLGDGTGVVPSLAIFSFVKKN